MPCIHSEAAARIPQRELLVLDYDPSAALTQGRPIDVSAAREDDSAIRPHLACACIRRSVPQGKRAGERALRFRGGGLDRRRASDRDRRIDRGRLVEDDRCAISERHARRRLQPRAEDVQRLSGRNGKRFVRPWRIGDDERIVRNKVLRAAHVHVGVETIGIDKRKRAGAGRHDLASLRKREHRIEHKRPRRYVDLRRLISGKRRRRYAYGASRIDGEPASRRQRSGPCAIPGKLERRTVNGDGVAERQDLFHRKAYRAGADQRKGRRSASRLIERRAGCVKRRARRRLKREDIVQKRIRSRHRAAARSGGKRDARPFLAG